MTCTVHEVENHLQQLLDRIQSGEEITILREGEPVARLVAPPHANPNRKPILGSMQGQMEFLEGWDEPMTADQLEQFLAGPLDR